VLSGILTARFLGPEGRGEFAILGYFPALMASFAALGLPEALSYLTARKLEERDALVSAGIRIAGALALLSAFSFAYIAPLTLTEDKRDLAGLVTAVCLLAPPMVVNPGLWAMLRGMGRFGWVNALLIFNSMAWPLLLLILWIGGVITPTNAILGSLGLQMITLLLNANCLGFRTIMHRPPWEAYKRCMVQGLLFFAPALATLAYLSADRALLMQTCTLTEIGIYSVAFTIAHPLSLISETFVQITFVEVSRTTDNTCRRQLALKRFRMAQVAIVTSAAAMCLAMPLLVPLAFGVQYAPAVTASFWLVFAMALRGLNRMMELSIRAMNRSWPGVVSSLAALLFLVALGLPWSASEGSLGFARACVIAESAAFLVLAMAFCGRHPSAWAGLWGFRPSTFRDLAGHLRGLLRKEGRPACAS
jgi:O-antigen/teichoic acid export membrane protein